MTTYTVEYLRTSVLSICYNDKELQRLCDLSATEGPLSALMSVSRSDARRIVAGLLTRENIILWSTECASRAKRYAAQAAADAYAYAAYADAADAYAYAADAADADAAAYAAAAYAATSDAEHRLAMIHGLQLLNAQ